MAYIQDANDPNAQNQPQQGGGNQPLQTSTGGGGTSTISGGGQGVTAVPNASKAPPVQNLSEYLQANAPQAVQMGQNIAGNLNQAAEKVTGDVNATGQNFNQGIQAQNVVPNQELVNQAANNPAEFVKNPQNVTDFLAQENANYSGPAAFEQTPEYSNINQEVQSTLNSVPDINKPGGIEQLVRSQEINPTMGMTNLDTLLMQGNPGAVIPIQEAIPGIKNLADILSQTTSSSNKTIQDAIANSLAAKQGIQDKFLTGPNAVVPEFGSQLTKQASDRQAAIDKAVSDLESGGILTAEDEAILGLNNNPTSYSFMTPGGETKQGQTTTPIEQLASLYQTGLSPEIYKNPIVVPWSNFLKNTIATKENTASPEDYAKAAALDLLLQGQGNIPLNQSTIGEALNPTLPGDALDLQALSDFINTYMTNKSDQFAYQPNGPKDFNTPWAFNPKNIAGFTGLG